MITINYDADVFMLDSVVVSLSKVSWRFSIKYDSLEHCHFIWVSTWELRRARKSNQMSIPRNKHTLNLIVVSTKTESTVFNRIWVANFTANTRIPIGRVCRMRYSFFDSCGLCCCFVVVELSPMDLMCCFCFQFTSKIDCLIKLLNGTFIYINWPLWLDYWWSINQLFCLFSTLSFTCKTKNQLNFNNNDFFTKGFSLYFENVVFYFQ